MVRSGAVSAQRGQKARRDVPPRMARKHLAGGRNRRLDQFPRVVAGVRIVGVEPVDGIAVYFRKARFFCRRYGTPKRKRLKGWDAEALFKRGEHESFAPFHQRLHFAVGNTPEEAISNLYGNAASSCAR